MELENKLDSVNDVSTPVKAGRPKKLKSTTDRLNERKSKMRKRVPLKDQNVIFASQKAGFKRRVVADRPGRLRAFETAGYTFVYKKDEPDYQSYGSSRDETGGKVTFHLGNGEIGYLMEIPLELWEEDQRAKQADIDERMRVIESASLESANPRDRNKFYGKIEIGDHTT